MQKVESINLDAVVIDKNENRVHIYVAYNENHPVKNWYQVFESRVGLVEFVDCESMEKMIPYFPQDSG